MKDTILEEIKKLEEDISLIKETTENHSPETLKSIQCFEELKKHFQDLLKSYNKLVDKYEDLELENGNLEYERDELNDEIGTLESEIGELENFIVINKQDYNLPTTYVYEKIYALLYKYGPYKLEEKLDTL